MWEKIKIFFAMGETCVGEAWSFATCREFWALSAFVAVSVVMAVLMLILFTRRWRLNAMRRATKKLTLEYLESQKQVADDMTMQRLKWKGDSLVAPEQDQAHLTADIRDALRSRKLNGPN
jgi:hypothetical protein